MSLVVLFRVMVLKCLGGLDTVDFVCVWSYGGI